MIRHQDRQHAYQHCTCVEIPDMQSRLLAPQHETMLSLHNHMLCGLCVELDISGNALVPDCCFKPSLVTHYLQVWITGTDQSSALVRTDATLCSVNNSAVQGRSYARSIAELVSNTFAILLYNRVLRRRQPCHRLRGRVRCSPACMLARGWPCLEGEKGHHRRGCASLFAGGGLVTTSMSACNRTSSLLVKCNRCYTVCATMTV
jgi:hypothetical protein